MKILYHGSTSVIKTPEYGKGNPHNDYGFGFYCTENIELAKEWACLNMGGGFVNAYTIDTSLLKILNLSEDKYTILHWLSILINNRTFIITNQIAGRAKEYLLANFLPDISRYDAVMGYRADDSYFAFAVDFLNNTISLRQLERAMYLGKLGQQFMLRSKKAFKLIQFTGSEPVDGRIYYPKRVGRDRKARDYYLRNERPSASVANDLFMIDILRQEIKENNALFHAGS